MQLSEDVLKGLGLTTEATEEEVNTALLAKLTTPPAADVVDPPAPPAPAPVTDITPTPAPEVPVVEQIAASAPTLPAGVVMIDEATLAELKSGAAVAASLQGERDAAIRNGVLDNAIKAGKFPPARRAHFEALLTVDPEGTAAMIETLASGMIPVTERGTSTPETEVNASEASAYPEAWKPAVAASQRANNSSRVKVGVD
jgi:hypothetical protein